MVRLLTWVLVLFIGLVVLWMAVGDIHSLTDHYAQKWLLVGVFLCGVLMGWFVVLPRHLALRWMMKKIRKELSQYKVVRERAKMASQLLN
ncbi:hypothetical protein DTO96_100092 [Ephemeroptericola cinctiostellae]|uniref:Lipopolysaccharide assembly protein A domain-containing protein n=1 Tax=Ephemeroptericola cinctiostellae TaxID=2268024 RepID=A0A345D7Q1_9BURK|nr:LapA family protein [Ephemeroptericola cinctiostellae]AXF84389.1 hypothetical protein DTO96_100092 [Ephemeroptericola cinctiostellae]